MRHQLIRVIDRLRATEQPAALPAVLLAELVTVPGIRGAVCELDRATGAVAWLAGPAFEAGAVRAGLLALDPIESPPYMAIMIEGGVAARHGCIDATSVVWSVPLVGCGEVVGAIRIASDPAEDWAASLLVLAMHVSVRLAQLGDPAEALLGARPLTPRQLEVVVLVARGCTNFEVARMLSISANAVKKHVSRAFEALQVSNRTELAALTGRWSAAAAAPSAPWVQRVEAPVDQVTSNRSRRAA